MSCHTVILLYFVVKHSNIYVVCCYLRRETNKTGVERNHESHMLAINRIEMWLSDIVSHYFPGSRSNPKTAIGLTFTSVKLTQRTGPEIFGKKQCIENQLLPRKLTCSLKNTGWKTTFILEKPIFRGYIRFREGNFAFVTLKRGSRLMKCDQSWSVFWPIQVPEGKNTWLTDNKR